MASKNGSNTKPLATTSVPPTNPSSGVPFGYLPAFLPGSSSLVEQLDRRLLIVLRDGRHLIGVLRSFDQFSNCVLEDTSERRILQTKTKGTVFMDIKLGLFLVRGDSMVLLGEVEDDDIQGDDDNESSIPNKEEPSPETINGTPLNNNLNSSRTNMRKVAADEFEALLQEEDDEEYKKALLKWDFDTDLVV